MRRGGLPEVAEAVANGFDDPRSFFPWFIDAGEAETFLQQAVKAAAKRFDRRDFRRALGQFATGVTVVSDVRVGRAPQWG